MLISALPLLLAVQAGVIEAGNTQTCAGTSMCDGGSWRAGSLESVEARIKAQGITDLSASHWAAEAILDAIGTGQVGQPVNGLVQPNRQVTFYEAAVVALAVHDGAAPDIGNAASAAAAVVSKGYLLGPVSAADRPFTRLEAAYMAAKILGYTEPVVREAELAELFTDAAEIPPELQDLVYYVAIENRLFVGYPDRTLRPGQVVTLAQYAVLLQRIQEIHAAQSAPSLEGP